MMKLIEDSRQQSGKHELKHTYFTDNGISFFRCKIPFGDYCLPPGVAVDTKADIYELAMDIDQDHQRFKNELVTARDYGCKLIILVENTDNVVDLGTLSAWREGYDHYMMRLAKSYKAKRIEGSRLAKACKTLSERYGATFLFCKPDEAGEYIVRLLNNDNNINCNK